MALVETIHKNLSFGFFPHLWVRQSLGNEVIRVESILDQYSLYSNNSFARTFTKPETWKKPKTQIKTIQKSVFDFVNINDFQNPAASNNLSKLSCFAVGKAYLKINYFLVKLPIFELFYV